MFTIRFMQEEEREEVTSLVHAIMRRQYHCDAYPLPETVLIGRENGILVGAMAMSFPGKGRFPLEETYALDYDTFPDKFDRAVTIQLGRWVATIPGIAEPLLHAAVGRALARGCTVAIGEVKPKIARRYAMLGLKLFPLSGEILFDRIPRAVLPYYLLPPPPMPCAMRLAETAERLAKRMLIYS